MPFPATAADSGSPRPWATWLKFPSGYAESWAARLAPLLLHGLRHNPPFRGFAKRSASPLASMPSPRCAGPHCYRVPPMCQSRTYLVPVSYLPCGSRSTWEVRDRYETGTRQVHHGYTIETREPGPPAQAASKSGGRTQSNRLVFNTLALEERWSTARPILGLGLRQGPVACRSCSFSPKAGKPVISVILPGVGSKQCSAVLRR